MKRTNSFILFARAFKNAKNDFWVSIQVLFFITIGLAFNFWWVEGIAQPDVYGGISGLFQSFVWAITRYIGDPGHFATDAPVTLAGRWIDTAIGILKILIFAVPAGLVANGFKKAMDDDKQRIHLEECRERICKSFRRILNKATNYRVPPRNVGLVSLQAKKGMTENDIIDTVSMFPDFRLRNLATSQTRSEHPQDRLVIEMVPSEQQKTVDGYKIEGTKYGIKINRESNVTIIAPTSGTECTIGYFAYYIAQFGGFNFVSREFVKDVDDPVSYYTISDESKEYVKAFVDDIKSSSKEKEHWNIFMISAENVHDTQIHLIHKFKQDDNICLTTLDEDRFQQFYASLSETLKANHDLLCDLDDKYRPVGKKNIGVKTGGGSTNNAFTMRISYSVTTWTDSLAPIILDTAKVMRQFFETEGKREFKEHSGWKLKGNGFGINKDETNNKE